MLLSTFLAIFGGKMAFLSKSNAVIIFLHKQTVFCKKIRYFLTKIFKNRNIDPRFFCDTF
jgi:hypothetical protein